jgi:MFS family permease
MATSTVSSDVQRRITATLFTTQSLFGAALIATFALTSLVAARLSGIESWAGLPAMLVLGGKAFIGYPVGWFMDRYGRRAGFVIGYLLGVVGALLSAHAIVQLSFWEFCIGATALGMGRGISEQTRYAAAEVYPERQRASVIGLIVWAGTIGSIAGPLLVDPSSHLATWFGLDPHTGPFLAAAIMAFVAMILTFLYLQPEPGLAGRQWAANKPSWQADAPTRSLKAIFASGGSRLAVTAMTIGQLVMSLSWRWRAL